MKDVKGRQQSGFDVEEFFQHDQIQHTTKGAWFKSVSGSTGWN